MFRISQRQTSAGASLFGDPLRALVCAQHVEDPVCLVAGRGLNGVKVPCT